MSAISEAKQGDSFFGKNGATLCCHITKRSATCTTKGMVTWECCNKVVAFLRVTVEIKQAPPCAIRWLANSSAQDTHPLHTCFACGQNVKGQHRVKCPNEKDSVQQLTLIHSPRCRSGPTSSWTCLEKLALCTTKTPNDEARANISSLHNELADSAIMNP